jgi:hypothetical protein
MNGKRTGTSGADTKKSCSIRACNRCDMKKKIDKKPEQKPSKTIVALGKMHNGRVILKSLSTFGAPLSTILCKN